MYLQNALYLYDTMSRRKNSLRGTQLERPVEVETVAPPRFRPNIALVGLLLLAASLTIALTLYSPTLSAPFLFDDFGLPYTQPAMAERPVSAWMSGLRPVLMLSYWIDFQLGGGKPDIYHLTNVLIHSVNSILFLFICWSLLKTTGLEKSRALTYALFTAVVFLVHPLQTESVAYIAGRSELVCALFLLSAVALFCSKLHDNLGWRTSLAILALYIAACLSKEQAAVLPAVLFAIDVVLGGRSPKHALARGVRLYAPIAVAAAGALIGVASVLAKSTSAGFGLSGVQWYEYALTQPRIWLMYIRLVIFPIGQNADYDIPFSQTLFEFGTVLPIAVLLAGAIFVWLKRRSLPLAAGGLLLFAILLAPTSSVVPIQDAAAERRMYLPLAGLLLAFTQVLVRGKMGDGWKVGLFGFVLFLSAASFERAKAWSSDLALWTDITEKSPDKARGYTHVALAHLRSGQCAKAIELAHRIPESVRANPEFMGALGQAYICVNRMDDAIRVFEQVAHKWPSTGRLLALSSAYSSAGRLAEAQAAEQNAARVPPRTAYDFLMLDLLHKSQQGQTRSRFLRQN